MARGRALVVAAEQGGEEVVLAEVDLEVAASAEGLEPVEGLEFLVEKAPRQENG